MMKKITYLLILLLTTSLSYGQSIFSNPITGSNPNNDNPYTTGQVIDPNITVSGIGRGPGATGRNATDEYSASSWNTVSFDASAYFEFTLTPNLGYEINFVNLTYNSTVSATGPTNFSIRSSIDAFSSDITSPAGAGLTIIDLSASTYQNISSPVTFRIYAWGASSNPGRFRISDFTFNGAVAGTCTSTVTWNGTNWSAMPDITTEAIINGNYSTTTNGSFSACTLTVNSGFLLRVNDGTYVEVENDSTVDGQLFVDNQGNFIQNSDTATFTDNTTNGVLVSKTKTIQNKFIYTYWSSPISNGTIENTFSTIPIDKRFSFNATNFVDLLEEIGNTNTFLPNAGVDDQDDDGNDWEYASGAMIPGVGYAMRTNEFGPAFPRPETFDFIGSFNNGVIQVPLINNSGGAYNDWNFVGNPYPSAINASQFFTANTGVVDVIYLWDQATPLDPNASGNQGNNYSSSDYAMINSSGAISGGGAGTIPNGSIASGQGFFVEALAASNLTFNNSMRAIGTIDNSQFFKNSNFKTKSNTIIANKLWVSLTTDNGAFNQILISYIENATSDNDGSAYDAKRVISSGNSAFLYSRIENDNDKFAIQGKAPSDLNENEIIDLGFKTIIDVPTSYTLSIRQLQGDFLNNNPIYLKDNLLDKTHNLSDSDYTFTSEVGEFNNRFKIVFNDKSLSTDDINSNENSLTIIELNDNQVNFKTSNGLSIKAVIIYDLLGRQLYNFKGKNNNSETYELSSLKSTIFIAKVELSNGITVTKKAIKK
ncbi:hypothetical protein [Jejuia spongiicola]|uniref:T9SS type A sorting domain-containing protein n=1 Tax=Jejuia spongiicola TaxID=2942207 RepID=A0ABT0Q9L1_9FLAO|nr:hypothetical protein [Jejuia spongiicola]MCL6293670.1 hypothetical protein [Jejuia spongiicola]